MNRPRHLALVITELEVGGAEQCLVNLALRLDPQRFIPTVYSLAPRPRQGQSQLVDRLEHAGVPVEFLGATSIRHAWRTYRRLKQKFTQRRPDLVQTFLFHANVLGGLAAHSAGISAVAGIRVADPSRWRQFIERAASANWQHAVCVSAAVAQHVKDRVRLPSEKISVIPNGIDLARFPDPRGPVPAESLGLQPGRRIVVTVGRLHPQKGIDWLLRLAPDFLTAFPDVDLLVVGHGPAERDLRQLAAALSIEGRVRFLGWRDDVPRILASSHLFVLPSRWEGMPNAVLEAMASGLPVVATQAEGIAELLGEAALSQSLPWGDSAGFVDRVREFLGDRSYSEKVGQANRDRVTREFTLQRMVERHQDLYEKLLSKC